MSINPDPVPSVPWWKSMLKAWTVDLLKALAVVLLNSLQALLQAVSKAFNPDKGK